MLGSFKAYLDVVLEGAAREAAAVEEHLDALL